MAETKKEKLIAYPVPRIRGNAIEVEGGWSYEFFVAFPGEGNGDGYGWNGEPFTSRDLALKGLNEAVRFAAEKIEEIYTGEKSGKFVDFKTNEVKEWSALDENRKPEDPSIKETPCKNI